MVLDHWTALEADFRRYYTIDLAPALWGTSPMSARRFRVLTAGLPATSKLVHDIAFDGAAWGHSEELLAALVEQVDLTNRILLKANTPADATQPDPIRIDRPGRAPRTVEADPEPPVMSAPHEVAAFFGMRYVGPEAD